MSQQSRYTGDVDDSDIVRFMSKLSLFMPPINVQYFILASLAISFKNLFYQTMYLQEKLQPNYNQKMQYLRFLRYLLVTKSLNHQYLWKNKDLTKSP